MKKRKRTYRNKLERIQPELAKYLGVCSIDFGRPYQKGLVAGALAIIYNLGSYGISAGSISVDALIKAAIERKSLTAQELVKKWFPDCRSEKVIAESMGFALWSQDYARDLLLDVAIAAKISGGWEHPKVSRNLKVMKPAPTKEKLVKPLPGAKKIIELPKPTPLPKPQFRNINDIRSYLASARSKANAVKGAEDVVVMLVVLETVFASIDQKTKKAA